MSNRITHNDDVYMTTWWIDKGELKLQTGWYVVRGFDMLDSKTALCELISKEGEDGMRYDVSILFHTRPESIADAYSEILKSGAIEDIKSGLDLKQLEYFKEQYPERFI